MIKRLIRRWLLEDDSETIRDIVNGSYDAIMELAKTKIDLSADRGREFVKEYEEGLKEALTKLHESTGNYIARHLRQVLLQDVQNLIRGAIPNQTQQDRIEAQIKETNMRLENVENILKAILRGS